MISKISTRDGYGRKLSELDTQSSSRVVVLTADLAESSRVKAFAQKYPERFIQTGISEQDMFGIANGLALAGKIPITNTFAAFCLRAYEQARIIAINNSNVKIVGHHSGISLGQDGVSQMCEQDISAFRTLPNFSVIAPCDAIEAQKALNAIIEKNGPCYLRLSREASPILTNEFTPFIIGKANIIHEGSDILIVACGLMVAEALRAANILAEKGINACVMNMHTIKPLDNNALLQYAKKCGIVLTVEEHSIYGGLASAVCESLSESRIPIKNIGIEDAFGESGNPDELFKKFGLTAQNISEKALEMIKSKEKFSMTTKEVKEINDMMHEINTEVPQPTSATPEKKPYNDPRGRIIKMTIDDKRKVDDVLYKMFGGRKN